jgi:LacI family transcriptional regulator
MNPPGPNHRRVTMSDVAAVAHVHKSTVSLALRNQPKLNAATRERIRKIAVELGYRPDPMLDLFNLHRRTLAPPRAAGAIAFVSDLPNPAALARSERHEMIFSAAREEAKRMNFALELFLVGPAQLSASRLSRVLQARGITGILLGALSPATRSLDIDWSKFCVVGIESMQVEPSVDNVSTDYCQAARLCALQLWQRGKRKVGFIVASSLGAELEGQLRAGYLIETYAKNPAEITPFFRLDEEGEDGGGLSEWIASGRLDAVVGCGVNVPGLAARIQSGVSGRLTWSSIDIRNARSGCPGVPALHGDLGRRAVELLIMRLQINLLGLPANPATTFFPVEWRDSVK